MDEETFGCLDQDIGTVFPQDYGPPNINQFPTRINHLRGISGRHTQIFNMMAHDMQDFDNCFKVRWFNFYQSVHCNALQERNKQTNKQTIKFDESTEHNDDFQSQDPASSFCKPFGPFPETFRLLNAVRFVKESVMKKILEDVEVACVQDHSASWMDDFQWLPPGSLTVRPLKIYYIPKRKEYSLPTHQFFRGELLNFGGVF